MTEAHQTPEEEAKSILIKQIKEGKKTDLTNADLSGANLFMIFAL